MNMARQPATCNVSNLLCRDKVELCRSIKAEYSSCGESLSLTTMLDYLLDPTKTLYSDELIVWSKCIIAGGCPDTFAATGNLTFSQLSTTSGISVAKYDNAVVCGRVWQKGAVAYRCRTCQLVSGMSCCVDCFRVTLFQLLSINYIMFLCY